jgi:hypothetical protein
MSREAMFNAKANLDLALSHLNDIEAAGQFDGIAEPYDESMSEAHSLIHIAYRQLCAALKDEAA